ncbi:hypothetical protein [Brevundimonas sp. GCM10030266]|uniref:hypothetical protein n=1 Tax=Brevundimonas sp. GCM10030266 TaxID=3273386 RepID=UPI00360AD6F7
MSHESPHDQVADAVHEGRPVEAQYVRQGRSGVRILLLLVVSAGAAAVLLLGLWLVTNGSFAALEPSSDEKAVEAQAFDAPVTADAPTTSTGEPATPPAGTTPNVNATTTP